MTIADRERLIAQLPPAHAVALRLHRAGHGDDVVAAALGVPEESVPTLFVVARAKLAQLADGDPDPHPAEEHSG